MAELPDSVNCQDSTEHMWHHQAFKLMTRHWQGRCLMSYHHPRHPPTPVVKFQGVCHLLRGMYGMCAFTSGSCYGRCQYQLTTFVFQLETGVLVHSSVLVSELDFHVPPYASSRSCPVRQRRGKDIAFVFKGSVHTLLLYWTDAALHSSSLFSDLKESGSCGK